jgi:tRNA 2-thiouridine synthesizing protein E
MPTVEFMGKSFSIDEDGFIDSYENWSQEWVQWVKKEEGIDELNEEHQKVIKVLRGARYSNQTDMAYSDKL